MKKINSQKKTISVSMTKRHQDYLIEASDLTGLSKTEIIRRALDMLIASEHNPLRIVKEEKKEYETNE